MTQTAEKKREKVPMNGVDTPTLFATINAVKDQPELAEFQFRASSKWVNGTHSRSRVESFTGAGGTHTHETNYGFDADHPKVLTGTGKGATPVEFLLHGLAGCLPEMATQLPSDIVQLVPSRYRNPTQLPGGGVLVVGASASGIQLADEIHSSGRPVTVAVGRHTRMPRRYRGRDILRWLDAMGVFDESASDVYDIEVSRRQPSLQLVGRPDHRTLDLPLLQGRGVRLAGRATTIEGSRVSFADDLVTQTVAADARLARLLQRIDRYVDSAGLAAEVGEAEPFVPFCWTGRLPGDPRRHGPGPVRGDGRDRLVPVGPSGGQGDAPAPQRGDEERGHGDGRVAAGDGRSGEPHRVDGRIIVRACDQGDRWRWGQVC
jgi:hypothetical protein